MNKYLQSKVYKIIPTEGAESYIGSSTYDLKNTI